MCRSSCGMYVECCCDCYTICRKRIMACWIMDSVGLTSGLLTTFTSVTFRCSLLYTWLKLLRYDNVRITQRTGMKSPAKYNNMEADISKQSYFNQESQHYDHLPLIYLLISLSQTKNMRDDRIWLWSSGLYLQREGLSLYCRDLNDESDKRAAQFYFEFYYRK